MPGELNCLPKTKTIYCEKLAADKICVCSGGGGSQTNRKKTLLGVRKKLSKNNPLKLYV